MAEPSKFLKYQDKNGDFLIDECEEFGYKSLPNSPLLSSFAGQPYVDCSLSFSSFIPNEIPKIKGKIIGPNWIAEKKDNIQDMIV